MPYRELMEARLRFLEITEDSSTALRRAHDILKPEMDRMLDEFYAHLLKEPELKMLFDDEESIDRARSAQKKHWLGAMQSGKFDSNYYEKAEQIGRAHARVGLMPNWYIGGYCQMLNKFVDVIHQHFSDDPQSAESLVQAINKVVFLDIDLVIHSYLDAKDDALRRMLVASTELRAEMWGYSDALNLVADDIKSSIDSLAEQIPELNDSKAGNSSANRKEVQQQFSLLQTQADELRVETHSLEHHLSQLPMSEKLYLPKEGLLTRLFHKIFAKKHYYRH